MGRYYLSSKTVVENTTKLSIFKLKEFGLLRSYAATTLTWTSTQSGKTNSIGIIVDVQGDPYARVNYTNTDRFTGEKTDYDYKIRLTTTPCNFGGVRYWFICPLTVNGVYCGRRTGALYLGGGSHYFGCRHCQNLSYASRNETKWQRFGLWGLSMVMERKYDEQYKKIKRWTWRGKPTRKVRKLKTLEAKLNNCHNNYLT